MKKIKLVIFDLDGTLIHAYKAVAASFNYALNRLGYPSQSYTMIKRSVGRGDQSLLAKFIDAKDHQKALAYFREHHRLALEQGIRTLPGARSLLKRLRKDSYLMAVATNRPARFTSIILKILGWDVLFDVILSGDQMTRPKPNPDILCAILKKLKCKPSEALFVGDMDVDVLTGKRARVKTVAVMTGSSTKEELQKHKPFAIISKLSEIYSYIH